MQLNNPTEVQHITQSYIRYVGSILAAWVIYAAQFKANGWRLPLWCQLISSALMVIFVWILPESPRWLMAQGRTSDARKVLTRFHGESDTNHPIVTLQIKEMEYQIETLGSDKKWWDYRELFNSRARRRRLVCVVGMACFGQWSGNSVTSYYLPVMLENAGIVSQQRKLLLNGIYPPLCFVGALWGARLVDRVGRRPLLMGSLSFMIGAFCIITATSKLAKDHPSNKYAANVTITFIYLFGIIFSFGWTPLQPMYIAESLETSTRAKGKSLALAIISICGAVITYASGPAFENIKYYFYVVFIVWDVFELAIIYFFWPETKGRTLEELSEVFDAPDPVKKSLEKKNTQTVLNAMHINEKDLTV